MLKSFRTMSSIVQIDGSLGEGGGQVLRMALSLSALYEIPIEINNIRAGRPKPGLAAQHLSGVHLVQEMCNAEVRGAFIGSTHLEFRPGPLNKHKKEFVADTKTAGCICLLAQVSLPCALFFPSTAPITLILKGGTNVPMGPQIEYFTSVFKPMLNKFGADFDFIVGRRGYYPKGGGEIQLQIKPVLNLNAVEVLDPGIPKSITGWAYVAGSVHINETHTMAETVKRTLREKLSRRKIPVPPISIEGYREDRAMAVGNGSGINVVCTTTTDCIHGGSGLGSTRQEQSPPGSVAAEQILQPLLTRSCVDEHLQDQIIILMALARGRSRVKLGSMKLTCHTETAMQVAEIMLGNRGLQFKLVENGGEDNRILECEGCGLVNQNFQ